MKRYWLTTASVLSFLPALFEALHVPVLSAPSPESGTKRGLTEISDS